MTQLEIIIINMIRAAIDTGDYVGVRGLKGVNAAKKYHRGQYIKKSYDIDPDTRDCYYRDRAGTLVGTSAIEISRDMDDDDILKAVRSAAGPTYADNGKTCIITGTGRRYGDDPGEVVLYNLWSGAKFVGYLPALI